MSKKLIAIFIVGTIIFMCTFAACENGEKAYADKDNLGLVTDENGEKILAEDGQLLVYETDEDGKNVTDDAGENVTQRKQFTPIEDDGVIEDYGFSISLPDGWKTTNQFGVFENSQKKMNAQITVVKYFYDDYYKMNYDFYKQLQTENIEVTWERDISLTKGASKACRFTMKTEDGISIMYFFENSGNVYKIIFSGVDSESFVKDANVFCKSMKFKPFTYYDDITAAPTEEDVTK